MQKRNDDLVMTEETKALLKQAFVDLDLDSWSIGKKRAFLEQRGIRAGKMRKRELDLKIKLVVMKESRPVHVDPNAGVIDDLENAVEDYKNQ